MYMKLTFDFLLGLVDMKKSVLKVDRYLSLEFLIKIYFQAILYLHGKDDDGLS